MHEDCVAWAEPSRLSSSRQARRGRRGGRFFACRPDAVAWAGTTSAYRGVPRPMASCSRCARRPGARLILNSTAFGARVIEPSRSPARRHAFVLCLLVPVDKPVSAAATPPPHHASRGPSSGLGCWPAIRLAPLACCLDLFLSNGGGFPRRGRARGPAPAPSRWWPTDVHALRPGPGGGAWIALPEWLPILRLVGRPNFGSPRSSTDRRPSAWRSSRRSPGHARPQGVRRLMSVCLHAWWHGCWMPGVGRSTQVSRSERSGRPQRPLGAPRGERRHLPALTEGTPAIARGRAQLAWAASSFLVANKVYDAGPRRGSSGSALSPGFCYPLPLQRPPGLFAPGRPARPPPHPSCPRLLRFAEYRPVSRRSSRRSRPARVSPWRSWAGPSRQFPVFQTASTGGGPGGGARHFPVPPGHERHRRRHPRTVHPFRLHDCGLSSSKAKIDEGIGVATPLVRVPPVFDLLRRRAPGESTPPSRHGPGPSAFSSLNRTTPAAPWWCCSTSLSCSTPSSGPRCPTGGGAAPLHRRCASAQASALASVPSA